MHRYRLLAIGLMSMFARMSVAQQATASADPALPSIDAQLQVLTEKLNLTAHQQSAIRPILTALHDATAKITADQSLSRDERLAQVRPQRRQADASIRAILNDDQKAKLDEYERGPHTEMHDGLSGAAAPP
jgi:hypothetical protein